MTHTNTQALVWALIIVAVVLLLALHMRTKAAQPATPSPATMDKFSLLGHAYNYDPTNHAAEKAVNAQLASQVWA